MRTKKLSDFDIHEAELMLEKYVAEIEFRPMLILGAIRPLLFKIYIATSRSEEQAVTLIHELLHAFCEVNSTRFNTQRKLETRIEEAAQKFVRENPEFAKALLDKIKPGNGDYGFWLNPVLKNPNPKE